MASVVRIAAALAGLLLAGAAQAQQVPNPATAPLPHNTALKAASGNPQGAIRLGFAAAGDGGYQKYNWSPVNCLAADDGAQVQPAGTGCWLADIDKAQGVSAKIWGATGDNSTDDGPALRKACAWALTVPGYGGTVMLPSGVYRLNTLDSRGDGALYLTSGADDGRSCSLVGSQSSTSYPASGVIYGNTALRLGDHLNRPLILIPPMGSSPHLKYLTLDGNGASFSGPSNQDGWAGGPAGGRLFTVQVADQAGVSPETGPIFDDVVIMSGHNGNVYNGANRYMWSSRLWSNYSGKDGNNDSSVVDYGTDSSHFQPNFGDNKGCGLYVTGGAQHTVFGGAMWGNTCGLQVAGLQVSYLNLFGVNFQNNTYGILNQNLAPFSGARASAVTCTGCTFDGNTQADIYLATGPQLNKQMKFIAPSFTGHSLTSGTKPVYNIQIDAVSGSIEILTPSLSSSGTPWPTAWSNAPAMVHCTGQECPP